MSTNIKLKRSAVQGKVPTTTDLELGELAINTYDGKLYMKKDDGSEAIVDITAEGPTIGDATITFTGDSVIIPSGSFSLNDSTNTTIALAVNTAAIDITESQISDFGTYLPTVDFTATANTWLATRSTTNLSEGTNLYYTTARANTAIDARVTKSFVDALNVDADTLDGANGSYYLDYDNLVNVPDLLVETSSDLINTDPDQVVDQFVAGQKRTAKYVVQMTANSNFQASEVLLIHDDTDVYITEYGNINTNGSLGSISADLNSGYVRLLVSPTQANTSVVTKRITVGT